MSYIFGRINTAGCLGSGSVVLKEKLKKISELTEEERAIYDELNKKYIIENLHISKDKPKVKRK